MTVFKEGEMRTTQDVKISFTLQFDKDTKLSSKDIKKIDKQFIVNLPNAFCGSNLEEFKYDVCEGAFDTNDTFSANTTYEVCYCIKYYVTIYGDCIFYHVNSPLHCSFDPDEFEYKYGSIEYINKVRLANVMSNIPIIGKAILTDSISTNIDTDFTKEIIVNDDRYECDEDYD